MRYFLIITLLACGSPDQGAKVDVTQRFMDKLVNESYPRWQLKTNKTCPTIDELIAVLDNEGNADPWGNPYKLTCGEGSKIQIRSAGIDGQYDTADDVISPSSTK